MTFSYSMTFLAMALLVATPSSNAFAPAPVTHVAQRASALYAGYVPDGLTPQEYKKIKQQDNKKVGKDLGRLGPRGFKSRSMQAWQEAYEKGETGHSFAPLGYRQKLKQGKISKEEVPYMVRGGSWDNSDVFGARRVKWLKTDKEYARGGYKKEQSASILGSGPGFNWTGERRDDTKNAIKKLMPGFS